MAIALKTCTRCHETKPLDDFPGVQRKHSACKPCRAADVLAGRRAQEGVITPEKIALFWSRVDKNGPLYQGEPCWVWQGAPRNHEGYGQFHIAGRNLTPHTVMFMLTQGIQGSRDVFVDHLCKNRMCLNPDHLRLVTPRQNAVENNDSPFAKNAAKTHCPKGHPYSGDNLALLRQKNPRGTSYTTARVCLTCYPSNRNNPRRIFTDEGDRL